MKKFEAKSLELAYAQATKEFGCSITELRYEITQYPSSGIFGIFAKPAIIVASLKDEKPTVDKSNKIDKTNREENEKKELEKKVDEKKKEIADEKEVISEPKEKEPIKESTISLKSNDILDNFFDEKESVDVNNVDDNSTVDGNNHDIQVKIEKELGDLIAISCFDMDVVEVDVIDNTAYIFMDGNDAALLIGKEGYRYNALSYLIQNWLQNSYGLYIKLEIAQFLATQEKMITSYMEPVIEHVKKEGWGRTRTLDGVLVQIALEQLREKFPDKYVAIKRNKNGDRYVVINEFNKR